jgi:curved DNA-binding protein CbpA
MVLINEAYEVLSDVNQRTWYDNHRTQILSGSCNLIKMGK